MILNTHTDIYKAIKPVKYIVDETGYGDFNDLPDAINYIAGDITNRIGTIFVRQGQYTGMNIESGDWSGLSIIGDGWRTKIGNINLMTTCQNIVLDNFEIDFVKTNLPSWAGSFHGINFRNVTNALIRNILVSNCTSSGFNMDTSNQIKFIYCVGDQQDTSNTSYYDAFAFQGGGDHYLFGCYAKNIQNRSGYYINSYNSITNVIIEGSYAIDNATKGFYVNYYGSNTVNNVSLTNCKAHNNTDEDFYITNVNNINKTRIIGCDTDGTIIVGGNNAIITENTSNSMTIEGDGHIVKNNMTSALTDNSTNSIVSDNKII